MSNHKARLDRITAALDRADLDAVREWLDTLTGRQKSILRQALDIPEPLRRITGFEHLTDEDLDRLIADNDQEKRL